MNVVKHHSVSGPQAQLVYEQLEEGERLLLMAPIDFRASSSSGVAMIFFGFLWLVLCAGIIFCLRDGILPADTLVFFIIFITIGTLGGLTGMCLPFVMGRLAGRTVIAVTDRRVLGVRDGKNASWPLSEVKRFYYRERPDKSGGVGIDFLKPVYLEVAGFGVNNGISPLLCPLPDVARLVRSIMACAMPLKSFDTTMPSGDGYEVPLDTTSRLRIERQLDSDERIEWAARPHMPGWGGLLTLRLLICVLVASSWYAFVSTYGSGVSESILWFVDIVSMMTLLLVLVSVIPSIWKWKTRIYAITGKRALMIGRCLNADTEVASYPVDRTVILDRRKRRGGSGDLVLFQRHVPGEGNNIPRDEGFMRTPRADEAVAVFEQVRAAMHEKGAKAEASAPQ